jgi:hypothetical protein
MIIVILGVSDLSCVAGIMICSLLQVPVPESAGYVVSSVTGGFLGVVTGRKIAELENVQGKKASRTPAQK